MKILQLLFLTIILTSFSIPEDSPLVTTEWYLKCESNALPHTNKIIHLYAERPSFDCYNVWDFNADETVEIITQFDDFSINHVYSYSFSPRTKTMVIDEVEFRISKINEDEIILIATDY